MIMLRCLATTALVAVSVNAGLVSLIAPTAHAVTIDWVTVGNPGNSADTTTTYGAVGAAYRIGKYEVTIGQYANFLNAVDPGGTNPFGLYNGAMGTNGNILGILFSSGAASGQKYSTLGSPNRPVTYVSWFDAARFANWMHNGQGAGSTETGAYTLGGQTFGVAPGKSVGAQFYIPTENEWYKAAYYSPLANSGSGGFYTYPMQSSSAPGNSVATGSNQANFRNSNGFSVTQSSVYDPAQNYLTDGGAFTSSASYYGTFDQGGNVREWNDLTGTGGTDRGLRGGTWLDGVSFLQATNRQVDVASLESEIIGFRIASPIPEPATLGLASAGAVVACGWIVLKRLRRVRA